MLLRTTPILLAALLLVGCEDQPEPNEVPPGAQRPIVEPGDGLAADVEELETLEDRPGQPLDEPNPDVIGNAQFAGRDTDISGARNAGPHTAVAGEMETAQDRQERRQPPDGRGDRNDGHGQSAAPIRVREAVAVLHAFGDSGVSGTVHFTQDGESVQITGKITGLKPGKHGFHVHEFGDLSDMQTGKSAGSHFAPRGMPHGRESDQQRHVGDLGNITANEQGVATIDKRDDVILLNGPFSILGRALIVHEGEDQFTQPTGDAGGRVAGGVVGVAQGGTSSAAER